MSSHYVLASVGLPSLPSSHLQPPPQLAFKLPKFYCRRAHASFYFLWHLRRDTGQVGFFVFFFTFYSEDVLNSLDVAKIAQSVPGTLHSCPQGRREMMEEVF